SDEGTTRGWGRDGGRGHVVKAAGPSSSSFGLAVPSNAWGAKMSTPSGKSWEISMRRPAPLAVSLGGHRMAAPACQASTVRFHGPLRQCAVLRPTARRPRDRLDAAHGAPSGTLASLGPLPSPADPRTPRGDLVRGALRGFRPAAADDVDRDRLAGA